MTLADIQNKIYFLTNTSSNDFPNVDMLISLNNAQDKIQTMIISAQDGWDFDDSNKTDLPSMTTGLVANQPDYQLPTGTLNIKRVEYTPDGTNWYRVNPFDINERNDDTNDLSDLSATEPYYDILGQSIVIYPTPDTTVASGLKLWIARSATAFTSGDLTTGTLVPGFDIGFHEMLALFASYDYAVAKGLQNLPILKTELQEYERRLKEYYGLKQKDRQIVAKDGMPDYE